MGHPGIIVARSDGFGARMIGMINAMHVAERLALPFAFHWPETGPGRHGQPPAEVVFAQDFLAAHGRRALPRVDQLEAVGRQTTLGELERLLSRSPHAPLFVDQCDHLIEIDGAPPTAEESQRYWRRIVLSDRLAEIVAQARSAVAMPGAAVHARRGDIVYGDSRTYPFSMKYLPVGVVRETCAALMGEGRSVTLFSDDPDMDRLLGLGPGLLQPPILHEPDSCTPMERDVFELAALSCHGPIVGRAGSNFTLLAACMSGQSVVDPLTVVPRAGLVTRVIADVAAHESLYPAVSAAQDLCWLATEDDLVHDPAMRTELLDRAFSLDPVNAGFLNLALGLRLKAGAIADADARYGPGAEAMFALSALSEPVSSAVPEIISDDLLRMPLRALAAAPYLLMLRAQHTKSRDLVSPLAVLRRASRLVPESPLLRARYVAALVDARRYGRARAEIAALPPSLRDMAFIWHQTAIIAMREGKLQPALAAALRAVEKAPRNALLNMHLAWLLLQAGRRDDAARTLRDGEMASIGHGPASSFLTAECLRALGQTERADVLMSALGAGGLLWLRHEWRLGETPRHALRRWLRYSFAYRLLAGQFRRHPRWLATLRRIASA